MLVRVTSRYFYARLTSARLPIQPEFSFSIEGKNIKKNFIYDFIHVIPFMLKEETFEELVKWDGELRRFYSLQENGFYKVNVSVADRPLLKEKFRNLGFSALNFTDSRSKYQFYNLSHLWGGYQHRP